MIISVSKAYERAAVIIEMMTSGKLTVETAAYRLEEVNVAAGTNIACDIASLTVLKQRHQKTIVFEAMREEEDDYESSEEYEDSGN